MDTSPLRVWTEAVAALRTEVPEPDFERLIQPLVASVRGSDLILEAPGMMAMEVIAERYLWTITRVVERLARREVAVRLQVPQAREQQELFPGGGAAVRDPKPRARQPARANGLIPEYTFDNFVIGASNQFAHAACEAVASQPGYQYNPLFIYGGVGLGKTHLVNAIGHAILAREAHTRVVYLSAGSFMNELITALRRDRMEEFKDRFRHLDVLIIDDVQFLAGRERTQEEFFHTFNTLYEARRQIVLTCDKFPKEIPELEERLRNRFEWGLIADIQPPDLETRVAIIEKKADSEGIELPHPVALFIAHHVDSNVRELEGSLTRLSAFASLSRKPITEELAREVLRSTLRDKRAEITIESIQKAICEFYDLRPNELRSKKRTKNIVLPRQLAMYLCRRHTHASYPAIGDAFGGRDHSTVIHATTTVERRLRDDPVFRTTVERIERLLQVRA